MKGKDVWWWEYEFSETDEKITLITVRRLEIVKYLYTNNIASYKTNTIV